MFSTQLLTLNYLLSSWIFNFWFIHFRYIDQLSKELKKDFPLASATEKDENVNKDDIVHIYYKVTILKFSKNC